MAKFYGKVGFGESVESAPGVFEDVIIEKAYFGDVLSSNRQLREGERLNNDIAVMNRISIVTDAYLNNHFFAIRYIWWAGTTWTVQDVTVDSDGRPRLVLRLGGVYNGPTASGTPPDPDESDG